MTQYGNRNPADDFTVEYNPEKETWFVGVRTPSGAIRPHTNNLSFEESDEAYDWIDAVSDRYEEQYDQYLEENRYAITQSELYELHQNER